MKVKINVTKIVCMSFVFKALSAGSNVQEVQPKQLNIKPMHESHLEQALLNMADFQGILQGGRDLASKYSVHPDVAQRYERLLEVAFCAGRADAITTMGTYFQGGLNAMAHSLKATKDTIVQLGKSGDAKGGQQAIPILQAGVPTNNSANTPVNNQNTSGQGRQRYTFKD